MEINREIVILTGLQTQKPPQLNANGKFYAICSAMTFKLRPCESIILNLLPSLILQSLTVKTRELITSQTQDN